MGNIQCTGKQYTIDHEIHELDEYGNTKLMNAVMRNDYEDCKRLIWLGSDVNFVNESEKLCTALMLASYEGNLGIVKLLIKSGAKVNYKEAIYLNTALYWALLGGDVNCEVVRVLCKKGAKVNQRRYDGETPIMVAMRKGSLKTVKILLAHGAKLTVKDLKTWMANFETHLL